MTTTESIPSPLEIYARGLSQTRPGPLVRYARTYLEHAEGVYDRTTVLSYIEKLQRSGYKGSSLNFVFGVLRTLFRRNGWEWPFRRGEGPQVQESEVNAPAVDPALVGEMILAANQGILTTEEAAYLALGTTYGLRRTELAALDQADINLRDRTLYVATAKHGRARTHMVPEQIIPVLSKHQFQPVSLFHVGGLWEIIEYRIRFNHVERVGWHSLRRTINTLLLDALPPMTVASFLRWKQASSQVMPFRYSAVRFVGRETTTSRVFGEAQEVDEKVFAVHPFLGYWA